MRQRAPKLNTENQKKFSVTAYVDNNCSGSLPALDRNWLCVVEVPSVLANASLRGRPNLGLSCMTLGDMLEYLHHTQTILVKCRQTTRAVIIYIGCDQKLLFRFSVFSSGVQPSELHRKTVFVHKNSIIFSIHVRLTEPKRSMESIFGG